MNTFLEEKLDSKSRKRLKDSTFGIPEDRKYPLNDANHVKSAIAFFKHCPDDKKHSLAKRIISAAKKFGVTISKDSSVWKVAHESFIDDLNDIHTLSVVLEADKKNKIEDTDTIDPMDYTQDVDSDDSDDPIDYSSDDDAGTMADDDENEPIDYTNELNDDENEEDNNPQDYTQDIDNDDSLPNDDNSNVKPEDSTLGQNTDNNQQQPAPEEGGDDDTSPTDYTQDVDGGDANDGIDDNNVDDDMGSPADDGTGNQNLNGTELQNMQNDAFSNLSPEQMKIKITNIKQSFIDLYNDVVEVLERLSVVNKSSDNLESINFSIMTLNELKTMLNDHLVSTFETKSLVENQIVLQRFLAIYTMVVKILEKLSSKNDSDIKK